jgi:hypothetical protein
MNSHQSHDKDGDAFQYRVVVVDPRDKHIAAISTSAGWGLPRVSISATSRIAEAATSSLGETHGISTIQLALLLGDNPSERCLVHELIGAERSQSRASELAYVALDDVSPDDLSEFERQQASETMTGSLKSHGRFARLGWIDELLGEIGFDSDRSSWPTIRHINNGIDFCLMSLSTVGHPTLWFKAVGEPNTMEYSLTLALQSRIPAMVPKIIRNFPVWNAWLSEGVEPGERLDCTLNIGDWTTAILALARLQLDLVDDVSDLRGSGAKDWTTDRMCLLTEYFFNEAPAIADAQTSTKAKRIRNKDLEQLRKTVESALFVSSSSGIPETLNHGDIGHGNILLSQAGPVFLDWAEGYVGSPILSAEHLLAIFGKTHLGTPREVTHLRELYIRQWEPYSTPQKLRDVSLIAPGLAAFSYALMAHTAYAQTPDPTQGWPFLRSMLRRSMDEFKGAQERAA